MFQVQCLYHTCLHKQAQEARGDDSTVLSTRERGFACDDEADEDDTGEAVTSHQCLFIHQNTAEMHLCGDIALDATYKTTKYSLPLFLLVVRTHVGYITAAEFICEVGTADAISQPL